MPNRRGFVNVTETLMELVHKSGVQAGICLVNAMHIASRHRTQQGFVDSPPTFFNSRADMRHALNDSQLFIANRDRLKQLMLPNSLAVVNANDVPPTNADGTF